MTLNEQYLVDVIGFNPVERSMLASICSPVPPLAVAKQGMRSRCLPPSSW